MKFKLIEINKSKLSNKKFSVPRSMSYHFSTDIRRINEFMAARRADQFARKKKNKVKFSLTFLITLGQSLESKDKKRRILARNILKSNKLPDGRKVSEIKSPKISSVLNNSLKESDCVFDAISEIEQAILNLFKKMQFYKRNYDSFAQGQSDQREQFFTKSHTLYELSEKAYSELADISRSLKEFHSRPDPVKKIVNYKKPVKTFITQEDEI